MKTRLTLVLLIFLNLSAFSQYEQICHFIYKSSGFPDLDFKWLYFNNQNNEVIVDSIPVTFKGCRYYNYNDSTALLIFTSNINEQFIQSLLKSTLVHEKIMFIYPNYEYATDYFIVIDKLSNKIYLSNGLLKKCSECSQQESNYICKYYTQGGLLVQDTLKSLQSTIGFVSNYFCFSQ